jgi:hypothetical protein
MLDLVAPRESLLLAKLLLVLVNLARCATRNSLRKVKWQNCAVVIASMETALSHG